MERLNGLPQEEGLESKQEVIQKLNILGAKLLDLAVTHTSVWKRSIFEVPQDQIQELHDAIKDSPIGDMFENLKGFKQKEGSDIPYGWEKVDLAFGNPTGVSLLVEKLGPYSQDNYHSTSFSIIFFYGNQGNDYTLKASLVNSVQEGYEDDGFVVEPHNDWALSSTSFQPELYETGYERSDSKRVEDVSLDQLKEFYSLFKGITNATQVKEKTILEQMGEMKMVNQDTGETFYFNPSRQKYVSKDGIIIDEAESPLAKLPSEGPLKLVAQYLIEPFEEGEENPFLDK